MDNLTPDEATRCVEALHAAYDCEAEPYFCLFILRLRKPSQTFTMLETFKALGDAIPESIRLRYVLVDDLFVAPLGPDGAIAVEIGGDYFVDELFRGMTRVIEELPRV